MRNPTSAFRYATMKSTSFESFFRDSESEVLRRMSEFMEQFNVDTPEEGIQNILNG